MFLKQSRQHAASEVSLKPPYAFPLSDGHSANLTTFFHRLAESGYTWSPAPAAHNPVRITTVRRVDGGFMFLKSPSRPDGRSPSSTLVRQPLGRKLQ